MGACCGSKPQKSHSNQGHDKRLLKPPEPKEVHEKPEQNDKKPESPALQHPPSGSAPKKYEEDRNSQNDLILEPAPKRYIESPDKQDKQENNSLENHESEKPKGPPTEKKRGAEKRRNLEHKGDFEEIVEKVNIIKDKKINNNDLMFIIKSLIGHFLFYNLNESQMEYLVKKMFYCKAEEGHYLFEQGDQEATSFFILERGDVVVEIDRQVKRSLKVGEALGELALLYSAPRSASIRAQSDAYFWGIDRMTFRKTIEEMITAQFAVCRKFLDSINFFNAMTISQKNAIAHALSSQKFKLGQPIVREGDQASSYYIIQSGEVACMKDNKEVRRLTAGDTFGEQALYLDSIRTLTVTAATKETTVLALGRDVLTGILGGQVQQILYKNWQRWAYEKDEILKNLTKIQIEKLVEQAKYENKSKGECLLDSNKTIENIIILVEGNAIDVSLVYSRRKPI